MKTFVARETSNIIYVACPICKKDIFFICNYVLFHPKRHNNYKFECPECLIQFKIDEEYKDKVNELSFSDFEFEHSISNRDNYTIAGIIICLLYLFCFASLPLLFLVYIINTMMAIFVGNSEFRNGIHPKGTFLIGIPFLIATPFLAIITIGLSFLFVFLPTAFYFWCNEKRFKKAKMKRLQRKIKKIESTYEISVHEIQ